MLGWTQNILGKRRTAVPNLQMSAEKYAEVLVAVGEEMEHAALETIRFVLVNGDTIYVNWQHGYYDEDEGGDLVDEWVQEHLLACGLEPAYAQAACNLAYQLITEKYSETASATS